jgi:hypothetical protein
MHSNISYEGLCLSVHGSVACTVFDVRDKGASSMQIMHMMTDARHMLCMAPQREQTVVSSYCSNSRSDHTRGLLGHCA